MDFIENKRLSDLWLSEYGHRPIHNRHLGSAGFANWVGLHLGIINKIVLPEHKHDKLIIVDGLPGSNSPKIAESVRMLRHTHKYDKPIDLHGLDGDEEVIKALVELLSDWKDTFNFFPIHAFLTTEGVMSLHEKPHADLTIINHGVDDIALYELQKGQVVQFRADHYGSEHAREIVHLIGDATPQEIADAQERAAKSVTLGMHELTKTGGAAVLTHYNTINWTKYHDIEPDYFSLITAYANGAFELVRQMADIETAFNVQKVGLEPFVLYDSQREKVSPGENIFGGENLIVIRKD